MTFEQSRKFCDQELADQINWFHANNPHAKQRELDIYALAFAQGYRKALAAVALHGPVDTRK